ncbi:diaminopimelate epimerase [Dehalococcoides mccartyi]|uniref:Diaminopimelate epimerase n=1 Tax=Dehalococcoides mccartyi TaxID=61435 RepID=A0A0V8LY81_9CHLR|nr:diaminopimelate epimerase [Dehalococcoides mccartyi]KSV16453.1 diaminopimelate epimerase [Dehalococcoides mccartyi]
MKFTKLQSVGNDFVLIDPQGEDKDWSKLALHICHRHFGAGADGLMLILPSAKADFRMRIFNADGSEAEICGNGLRCLIHYIAANNLIGNRDELSIETLAGIRNAQIFADGRIRTTMGKPMFEAHQIPVAAEPDPKYYNGQLISDFPLNINNRRLLLSLVSMGNPHAIHFCTKPVEEFPLGEVGPLVETHKAFPKRTNFEVANILDSEHIKVRVWERGVGETLGCGSGASAVAVAAQILGYVGKFVYIKLPGGTLGVEWDGHNDVYLTGKAEIIYTGEWLKDETV